MLWSKDGLFGYQVADKVLEDIGEHQHVPRTVWSWVTACVQFKCCNSNVLSWPWRLLARPGCFMQPVSQIYANLETQEVKPLLRGWDCPCWDLALPLRTLVYVHGPRLPDIIDTGWLHAVTYSDAN